MKEGYDRIIVSRYLEDTKSDDDDFITEVGNWLFTKTINVLHGGNYTDAMVIFPAYKKDLIYSLDLDKEESYSASEKLFRTKISGNPCYPYVLLKESLKLPRFLVMNRR